MTFLCDIFHWFCQYYHKNNDEINLYVFRPRDAFVDASLFQPNFPDQQQTRSFVNFPQNSRKSEDFDQTATTSHQVSSNNPKTLTNQNAATRMMTSDLDSSMYGDSVKYYVLEDQH